jgi:hypothetical protein
MSTITRTITVDAPVEKEFDYALDIRKLGQCRTSRWRTSC